MHKVFILGVKCKLVCIKDVLQPDRITFSFILLLHSVICEKNIQGKLIVSTYKYKIQQSKYYEITNTPAEAVIKRKIFLQ